jgi:hypothetical protein
MRKEKGKKGDLTAQVALALSSDVFAKGVSRLQGGFVEGGKNKGRVRGPSGLRRGGHGRDFRGNGFAQGPGGLANRGPRDRVRWVAALPCPHRCNLTTQPCAFLRCCLLVGPLQRHPWTGFESLHDADRSGCNMGDGSWQSCDGDNPRLILSRLCLVHAFFLFPLIRKRHEVKSSLRLMDNSGISGAQWHLPPIAPQ